MITLTNNSLSTEQWIAKPVEEIFPFFSDPKNLEKITPPWLKFAIHSQSTESAALGTLIEYRLKMRGLPMRWKSEITEWERNVRFADKQLIGPYKSWYHVHTFTPKDGGTLMVDHVKFELPFGILGKIAVPLVKSDLRKIFSYRLETIKNFF
jgi:ligand-binding SRPBCC domain-containing protein